MRISVLITTYNRADYLRLCLLGYLRQSEGGFEILVSDDGSSDHTREVVHNFDAIAPFPVTYLNQPDEGHRRARAINRAVAAARGDWLVFSDCDSIPQRELIEVHRLKAEQKRLLCGGRVLMNDEETDALSPSAVLDGVHEESLTRHRKIRLWLQHIKNRYYVMIRKTRRPHNYAVNMSCSPAAMRRVNGYDHNFRGWGNADGDLRDRMRMVGIEPKSVSYQALIFHQWHQPDPTMSERKNKAYARRPDIPARCEKGLDDVLDEVESSSGEFTPEERPPAADLPEPLHDVLQGVGDS